VVRNSGMEAVRSLTCHNIVFTYGYGGWNDKKLIQHGDSAAPVIEKPILQLLGIDTDTELEIVTDGENLLV